MTTQLRGEEEIAYNTLLTDEEIITNSEIANRIMAFPEFFLAYKIASDLENNLNVILMDRFSRRRNQLPDVRYLEEESPDKFLLDLGLPGGEIRE